MFHTTRVLIIQEWLAIAQYRASVRAGVPKLGVELPPGVICQY